MIAWLHDSDGLYWRAVEVSEEPPDPLVVSIAEYVEVEHFNRWVYEDYKYVYTFSGRRKSDYKYQNRFLKPQGLINQRLKLKTVHLKFARKFNNRRHTADEYVYLTLGGVKRGCGLLAGAHNIQLAAVGLGGVVSWDVGS